MTGVVLRLLMSFLTGRKLRVFYNGTLQSNTCTTVSHNAVLGQLLFNLYTVDICNVVANHGLQLHQYANNQYASHFISFHFLYCIVLLYSTLLFA